MQDKSSKSFLKPNLYKNDINILRCEINLNNLKFKWCSNTQSYNYV